MTSAARSTPTGRPSSPRRSPRSWACPTDKVTAALEKLHEQRQGDRPERPERPSTEDRQAALKERLDQAVTDGKLTQEQADAVLKAAEAGVFPGGPGHDGKGGPHGERGGHGKGGPDGK